MRRRINAKIAATAVTFLAGSLLLAGLLNVTGGKALAQNGPTPMYVLMYKVGPAHWIAPSQLKSVVVTQTPSGSLYQVEVRTLSEGDFVVFTGTEAECVGRVLRYTSTPGQQSFAFVD